MQAEIGEKAEFFAKRRIKAALRGEAVVVPVGYLWLEVSGANHRHAVPGSEGEGQVIAQAVPVSVGGGIGETVVLKKVGAADINTAFAGGIFKSPVAEAAAAQCPQLDVKQFVELCLRKNFRGKRVGQLAVVAQVRKSGVVEILATRPQKLAIQ